MLGMQFCVYCACILLCDSSVGAVRWIPLGKERRHGNCCVTLSHLWNLSLGIRMTFRVCITITESIYFSVAVHPFYTGMDAIHSIIACVQIEVLTILGYDYVLWYYVSVITVNTFRPMQNGHHLAPSDKMHICYKFVNIWLIVTSFCYKNNKIVESFVINWF